MKKEKNIKKTVRRIIRYAVLAAVLFGAVAVCMSLFVHRSAVRTPEEYRSAFPDVVITSADDGSVEIAPGAEAKSTGLIFYVGAQITPDAYIPLLARLAREGYFCSIPKLPFNMASMRPKAAEAVMNAHPEISHWYLAGHSMGGYTASGYVADHPEKAEGLILLAAYTARDLSKADACVLSVYGDTDSVLNRKLYEKRLAWNPADFEEHILPGANHAGFGDYGRQPRDNDALVSAEEQQTETAAILCDWLARHEEA